MIKFIWTRIFHHKKSIKYLNNQSLSLSIIIVFVNNHYHQLPEFSILSFSQTFPFQHRSPENENFRVLCVFFAMFAIIDIQREKQLRMRWVGTKLSLTHTHTSHYNSDLGSSGAKCVISATMCLIQQFSLVKRNFRNINHL